MTLGSFYGALMPTSTSIYRYLWHPLAEEKVRESSVADSCKSLEPVSRKNSATDEKFQPRSNFHFLKGICA